MSIATSDFVDILQAGVAVFSVILLYKTLKNSKEANTQQAEIMAMDVKAKRADYMPIFDVTVKNDYRGWKSDGYGGGSPEYVIINFELKVKENTLSNFSMIDDNPNPDIFTTVERIEFTGAYYRSGDKIELSLLRYELDERTREYIKNDRDVGCAITIRFEDMIGNKYRQIIVFNIHENKTYPLPLVEQS